MSAASIAANASACCEHHAKIANTNPLSAINGFPYKIALPAPSLYGQFKNLRSISDVIEGLKIDRASTPCMRSRAGPTSFP